jgi:class 3 adenylate cyclase/PAS domain-containing protein
MQPHQDRPPAQPQASPAALPAPGAPLAPEELPTVRLPLRPPRSGGSPSAPPGTAEYAEHTAHLAGAVHAAHARAQDEISDLTAGLGEIAAALHTHTRVLEQAVEGRYAGEPGEPRVRLLAETLALARRADLRLARAGARVRGLRESAQASSEAAAALQHEHERLALLYQAAQELNSTVELEDVLGRVLGDLIALTHAERGFLMIWDDASGALRFTAARGRDGAPLAPDAFAISRGVVDQVWARREALLTTDAQEDERLREQQSVVAFGIHSVLCAPLYTRERGVGVVYVDSRIQSHLFDAGHLDLLVALCHQAAIAIENARLVGDLRERLREIAALKRYADNIFASIASGVITAGTDGQVTAFNASAERILARPAAAVLGGPLDMALADLADPALAEIVRRAAADGATTLDHLIERDLPGRGAVSLRLNASALRSADGEVLGVALVLDDLTELRASRRQTQEIERLFGRYVHPAVVRQLLADPRAVNLGGETRTISVVFADIRGYTGLAEAARPEALVGLLNGYLDILTEAIWQEEGTVTMFIGDALMAIFNAPLPQPDHAARAVRAALGMRAALERYRPDQPDQPGQSGEMAPVSYGIGVTTGEAVVGNIGARDRLQNYTAIGDAVNVAQRLQASAAANQILLSAPAYAAVAGQVEARELGPLLVKGKTQPIPTYELLRWRGA